MEQISKNIMNTIDKLNAENIIVYDIDGTLIHHNGTPNIPIIKTYLYAKSKGKKPVIVTARPGTDENIQATFSVLNQYGINGFVRAYFGIPGKVFTAQQQAKYKLEARQKIERDLGKIAISIGDMPFDIHPIGGIGFLVK